MLNRQTFLNRLRQFDRTIQIRKAIDILQERKDEHLRKDEIGRVWDRVSVAIDHDYSDENSDNDLWQMENELSRAVADDLPIFVAPEDAVSNWIPEGFELVTNPDHHLQSEDAVLPSLGTDWRLVADTNLSEKIGTMAKDIGSHIRYVATRNICS